MNKTTGIYAIINKVNGKMYIGSARDAINRWQREHLPKLKNKKHYNLHLQHAWNKYGENNFEFQLIEECVESFLIEKEGFWIEYHKSWDRQYGYNLNRYVQGRVIFSKETRHKMSDHMKKEWKTIKVNNYQGRNLGFIEFKLTTEKKEEIKKLRAEKLAWDDIFKQIGISKTQFYRAMKIKDGQYGGGKKNRATYKTMTPEIKQKAIELRKQGKTWRQIGEELGVNRTTFYKHNMTDEYRNLVRKPVTTEAIQKANKLRQEGKSWRAIGKQLGYSTNTLYGYCK